MKWLLELLGMPAPDTNEDAELTHAVERVVDGIDPRLRLLPGYQSRLMPSLKIALAHIDKMVEQIPGPLELSRETYVSNPEVKAFFVSAEELSAFLQRNSEPGCCSHSDPGVADNGIWALLCANKEERTLLGMDLSGNEIRREVKQTAINFYDHKLMAPATSEDSVRCGIKKCIFDGLITHCLQHVLSLKNQRQELEDQRRILHARLRARQSQGNGLSHLMASARSQETDIESIQEDLLLTEAQLHQLPASDKVLESYLQEIQEIFQRPDHFIEMNVACFRLNHMGIRVDGDTGLPASTVCFSELEIAQVLRRVVTLVHFQPPMPG